MIISILAFHNALPYNRWLMQYNTIQILLSTPHGGFSETNINGTGNKKQTNKQTKKILKNCQ